jgi:two-component system heavy metal sensor histidine kinase CusS
MGLSVVVQNLQICLPGTSIVATIMQLHSGRYDVTSEDGVRCFELFFPTRVLEG